MFDFLPMGRKTENPETSDDHLVLLTREIHARALGYHDVRLRLWLWRQAERTAGVILGALVGAFAGTVVGEFVGRLLP